VESNGKILGFVLLGLAILFGLTVFFVVALCFNKEEKIDIYKAMDSYE
jgi:hypothetical protein